MCTSRGRVKQVNEDKLMIVEDLGTIANRRGKTTDVHNTRTSYIGVFDGHGGAAVSHYLSESLHQSVASMLQDGSLLPAALKCALQEAEDIVLSKYFTANIGDCRAILYKGSTLLEQQVELTEDHRPHKERVRILAAGGVIKGLSPRLFPGGLSVSRTIGDLFAKDPAFGGNPNVTIATPDLHEYAIKPEDAFLVILTDGICDVLSGSEIKSTLNLALQEARKLKLSIAETVENMACELVKAAYNIMTSTDNLSCVVVSMHPGSSSHK